jgi:hypothetical protein
VLYCLMEEMYSYIGATKLSIEFLSLVLNTLTTNIVFPFKPKKEKLLVWYSG